MEDSAYEAIYLGVYIMIFVIAVSVSIFLFNSIYDYSELAFEYQTTTLNESVTVNAPANKYRLINGDEVISYFFNYIKYDAYGSEANKTNYIINIKRSNGTIIVSSTFSANVINSYTINKLVQNINVKSKYVINYTTENTNIIYIDIIEATQEQINALV